MTDPGDEPGLDWDETVDVLCVGAGPGALAYGILCAAAGLEVLIVESPDLDPQTLEFRDAMTIDLGESPPDATLVVTRAQPAPRQDGQRAKLETFVGEELRRWSDRCLASPFGVLLTEVPDLEPMRTDSGQSITAGAIGDYQPEPEQPGPALIGWLGKQADGLFAPETDRLDGLVIEEGRIAGVVLDTVDGPRRVCANRGLALSVGAAPETWPAQPELAGLAAQVAVVGRRGGRFARVELLAP